MNASDLNTSPPSSNRFDVVLSIVLVVLGIGVGIAIWYTDFYAMFLVPMAAVLLSLIGAAFARRHRYPVAFCAIAAVNAWWLVVAGSRGLLTDRSQLIESVQLVGIWLVLPLAIVFFILRVTRD